MKEKKNIDRLFQEKFKDFEAHPSSSVWNTISKNQKEKNDRKIIPLWWKLGGIAAALLLLFGLGILITNYNTPADSIPALVNQENNVKNSEAVSSPKTQLNQGNSPALEVSDYADLEVPESNASQEASSPYLPDANTTLATSTKTKRSFNNKERVASPKVGAGTQESNRNKTAAVSNNTSEPTTAIGYNNNNRFKVPATTNEDDTSLPVNSKLKTGVSDTFKNIASTDTPVDKDLLSAENTITQEKDLVAEAEKIAATKSKEELLSEDPLSKETNLSDRWDIGAVAAPVYYGDFGGSGIDPALKDNDRSGNVNLSYGVQVSYAVSPKLKVRTGVSNVDLSYNTNDLVFSLGGTPTRQLEGISYSQNGSGVTIVDKNDRAIQQANGILPGPRNEFFDGSVQQRLNYIEVPVEAVYTVSDKRLGIAVIGGISTLLLNDNEVLLLSDDLNTSLGTSNSANDVSFTTNIGLGLDYKVTEDFKLNLEPALKYQINGFDDSAGEFKPYYLGVYTGISYKF